MKDNLRSLAHPAVFIFGAGATRGGLGHIKPLQPPPVDSDFFDIANQLSGHGTPSLVKRVLKSVWELYGKTVGVSLEQYYRDIETRAMIGKFAKTANQPMNWAKRQRDLEELIRRVYVHTTCDTSLSPVSPKKSTVHGAILEQVKRGDTLITFNYDLLIEDSFKSAELWNPTDGYGVKVSGATFDWCRRWLIDREYEEKTPSEVTLLKLHGSLNWYLYRNKNICLKPRPYVVRTKNKKPAFEKISILPPGWNKPIYTNPYKKFWREARLRLEQCDSLIILGYSLPETDLLARALILEVIRLRAARKKYLKELHLADPDVKVRDRFIKLFLPALGPYGKVYQYPGIKNFGDRFELIK